MKEFSIYFIKMFCILRSNLKEKFSFSKADTISRCLIVDTHKCCGKACRVYLMGLSDAFVIPIATNQISSCWVHERAGWLSGLTQICHSFFVILDGNSAMTVAVINALQRQHLLLVGTFYLPETQASSQACVRLAI